MPSISTEYHPIHSIRIILPSYSLSIWQEDLMQRLEQEHYNLSIQIVGTDEKISSLLQWHQQIDNRVLGRRDKLAVQHEKKDALLERYLQSKSTLKSTRTDLILWFHPAEPTSSYYALSQYGIWRLGFEWKGGLFFTADWAGYLAFVNRADYTRQLLTTQETMESQPRIVAESWFRPHAYSLQRTQEEIYLRIPLLITRALQEINKNAHLLPMQKFVESALSPSQIFQPTIVDISSGILKHARIFFKKIIEKIKGRGQWILLVSRNSSFDLDWKNFQRILPPAHQFWADPFLWEKAGRTYLFFEALDFATDKGHISVLELLEDGTHTAPQPVLQKDYHLSYPFLWEWEGTIYMIPETSANRTIEVYECVEFPFRWQFKMNLMEDVAMVDTTLHYDGERWWLFANWAQPATSSLDNELFLFYADQPLTQEWQPHAKNPIVSDVRSARPAGNIFRYQNQWIRPAQDCSKYYGYGLRFFVINTLTPTTYQETLLTDVYPDDENDILRCHTFVQKGKWTVLDAQIWKKHF